MKKKFVRITLKERIQIETFLTEKRPKIFIANYLKRSRSTISREINNWVRNPTDKYDANLAHWYAVETNSSKRNLDKINTYDSLRLFVYNALKNKNSPEQIAGRLKLLYPNDPIMSISHEAIYQHIYKKRQSALGKELIALLPYHHHKRRNKRKFNKNKVRIKDQVSIDDRPPAVELRQEVGHWEGDLMIGLGQKSAIATNVERKTRYVFVMKIEDRKSKTVTQAFAKELKKLPNNFLLSMTYDNGLEMANHKWLTQKTGMNIYFAHPYSSWERGTNENTNGLIRRFFPKKTDFRNISEKQLKTVQNILNNRPRKVLGYRTPNEMMLLEMDRKRVNGKFFSEITFGSLKCQKSYSEKNDLSNPKFVSLN